MNNDTQVPRPNETDDVTFDVIRKVIFPLRDSVLFAAITGGNLMVIIVVSRYPHLRTGTNYLVASLACSDLMIGLCSFLNTWKWIFNALNTEAHCLVIMSLYSMSIFLSLLSLMSIAIDRLLAVKYPLLYRTKLTNKRVVVYICITWVVSIFLGLMMLYKGRKWPYPCNLEHAFNKGYVCFVGITILCIELILACLYVVIYLSYVSSRKRVGNGNIATNHAHRNSSNRIRDRNMTKIVFIVTSVFVVCYTPFAVSLIILGYSSPEFEQYFFTTRGAFLFLALANSVVNPIIYGITNPKYRAAFYGILRCRYSVDNINGSVTEQSAE
ncbi:histamine H2 receptor-like [Tubulanus polymorphus]|uniref:histamine H2 receptor-like n=1 Tax=Tubulanus polymorphus TaxID=672921 RepID=UPI003DA22A93